MYSQHTTSVAAHLARIDVGGGAPAHNAHAGSLAEVLVLLNGPTKQRTGHEKKKKDREAGGPRAVDVPRLSAAEHDRGGERGLLS